MKRKKNPMAPSQIQEKQIQVKEIQFQKKMNQRILFSIFFHVIILFLIYFNLPLTCENEKLQVDEKLVVLNGNSNKYFKLNGVYKESFSDDFETSAVVSLLALGSKNYCKDALEQARRINSLLHLPVVVSHDVCDDFHNPHPEFVKFVHLPNIERGSITKMRTNCGASLGYRDMNLWRTYYQFKEPELIKYRYIIQMDVNLELVSIPCDFIKIMQRSKSLLGYYNGGFEKRECVGNLYEKFGEYKSRFKLQSPNPIISPSFSGGFLIFDVRLFTSNSYMHFIEFIRSTNLIYTSRLSDQVIFSYAMVLLTQNKYLHHFSGFKFNHIGGWGGDNVYSDKAHPIWHVNGIDPWCQENDEEYYWNMVKDIRKKNKMLATMF